MIMESRLLRLMFQFASPTWNRVLTPACFIDAELQNGYSKFFDSLGAINKLYAQLEMK